MRKAKCLHLCLQLHRYIKNNNLQDVPTVRGARAAVRISHSPIIQETTWQA